MNKMKSSVIDRILFGLTIILSSLLPFITSAPKMIGEPFDTRFQIVVHEHWYWFLKLERPLRDVFIFYPFDKTLGYSDIFFVNGLIYSGLRILSFPILDAWTITNFIIIFLGNVGFAFLFISLLKNKYLIILALITITNSYAFLVFFSIWPNTAGYALVSWVFFFLLKIWNSKPESFTLWLNLLLIYLPLLTLSFWYPGFFSIMGTILFFLLGIFSGNKSLRIRFGLLKNLFHLKKMLLFMPVWLSLWILFLFIVLPTRGNLRRDPNEIYKGSLSNLDFFSIDLLGPTYFKDATSLLFGTEWMSAGHAWSVGFPFLTFMVFLVIALISRRRLLKFNSLHSMTFFTIVFSIVLTISFNNFGLYIYLWQNFELLGVIRTPVRINILINFLMLFFIFSFFDKKIYSAEPIKKILITILIVFVSIDQFRVIEGSWYRADFLNKDLRKQLPASSSDCQYLGLVNEGAGHWSDTIEAMVLSSFTNIPTINGYSGTFPSDAIERNWDDPSDYESVLDYINRNNLSSMGCIFSNQTVNKLSKFSTLNIHSQEGESLWESGNNKKWVWITDQNTSLQLRNYLTNHPVKDVEINIRMAPCMTRNTVTVENNGTTIAIDLDKNNPSFKLKLPELSPRDSLTASFKSAQPGCQVDGDPRNLVYALELQN